MTKLRAGKIQSVPMLNEFGNTRLVCWTRVNKFAMLFFRLQRWVEPDIPCIIWDGYMFTTPETEKMFWLRKDLAQLVRRVGMTFSTIGYDVEEPRCNKEEVCDDPTP